MAVTPSNGRVARNVRAELARHGMSQADLAKVFGKSQAMISRRLTGEVAFNLAEIDVIAATLGVPVSVLMAEAAPKVGAA